MAGGRWDFFDRRFDAQNETCAEIEMEESQVPFVLWAAQFIADYREGYPRDISLVAAAGDRRAGKTFATYFCQIALLLDVPFLTDGLPTIGWTVSRTFRERDELDQLVLGFLPSNYYHHRRAPEHRFIFPHGSYLRNLSADDPDALKQGRADIILYNEPQKMDARAIVHGLYGTADRAGLTILAANRPSAHDTRGEWMYDLKEAIDDELRAEATARKQELLGAKFFLFSSKENTKIDPPARRRVGRIATIIDPAQAEADEDDSTTWRKPGERATRDFDKHKHLALVPEVARGVWRDCTSAVASERGTWGEWQAIGGVDFQDKSWAIAGVIARCFGDPDDPVIWFCDEHYENVDEGRYLDGFSARFEDTRGYTSDTVMWVGDASGAWQNSKHKEDERTSFGVWRDRGWTIVPPQEPKSDEEEARGRNPFVDDQLMLWNERLKSERIKFDPVRCEWLVQCVREAKTKRDRGRRRIVQNKHAHALAAALYLVWRIAGKVGGASPTPDDVRIIARRRR